MELHLISIFATLLVVSHAALPSEIYWEAMLPNTPMPKAIQELLHPMHPLLPSVSRINNLASSKEEVIPSLTRNYRLPFSEDGVLPSPTRNYRLTSSEEGELPSITRNYQLPSSEDGVLPSVTRNYRLPSSEDGVLPSVTRNYRLPSSEDGVLPSVTRNYRLPSSEDGVLPSVSRNYRLPSSSEDGVLPTVSRNYRLPSSEDGVLPTVSRNYNSAVSEDHLLPTRGHNHNLAASEGHLHDHSKVALYFIEKDLQPGTKMTLHFIRTTNGASFIPDEVAETVPFSSSKFHHIFNRFAIDPNSAEAEAMSVTIKECEVPANEGEEKYCATSLESMIDFSTSTIGGNIRVLSTEVDKEDSRRQKYNITSVERTGGENTVVCHGTTYAYAVFFCHATHTTRAYVVPMVGEDGTKANAVAVCHTDTSTWNPKHLAFQVLKAKPGTVSVCHFIPVDNVVWVSN